MSDKNFAIEVTTEILVSLIETDKLDLRGAANVDTAIKTAESINVLFNSIYENVSQKLKG